MDFFIALADLICPILAIILGICTLILFISLVHCKKEIRERTVEIDKNVAVITAKIERLMDQNDNLQEKHEILEDIKTEVINISNFLNNIYNNEDEPSKILKTRI